MICKQKMKYLAIETKMSMARLHAVDNKPEKSLIVQQKEMKKGKYGRN